MDIKKIQRTTLILTVWSFLYITWFNWFMLYNWQFNIFSTDDWRLIYNDWMYNGWIIQGSYFWIFIICLFLFIPVWIWSSCFFLSLNYQKYYEKLFWDIIYKKKTKRIQSDNKKIRVKKKKSYREVRPRALAGTPQMVAPVQPQAPADIMTNAPSASGDLFMEEKRPDMFDNSSYSRREISDNFEGESPFAAPDNYNLSTEITPSDKPQELKENLPAVMEGVGATVITEPTIGENKVDYMAVAQNQAFLILTDDNKGDWLADEERFNDEDPLWFSEVSHRTSPITILKKFEAALSEKLDAAGLNLQTHVILVKTDGNIINAEDMQETWKKMNVLVARSAFGMPEELPSFTDTFPKQLETADAQTIEQINALMNH